MQKHDDLIDDFFGELSEADRLTIKTLGKQVHFAPHSRLINEGETANYLYYILDGEVSIYLPGKADSGPIRVYDAGPSDLVGWSAVVPPHMYTGDAVALDRVLALRFSGPELLTAMGESPQMGHLIMDKVAEFLSRRLWTAMVQLSYPVRVH